MKKKTNSFFKSSEEAMSMFLGLVIVIVIVGLVVNFFSKKGNNAKLPGIEEKLELAEENKAMKGGEYVVVVNDSLWKIAVAKYNDGYKWVEIAKANNLKNPGKIEKGQKLILPEIKSAENTAKISGGEYIVQKGDHLWKIAVMKYNDGFKWADIYRANKDLIKNPNAIEIGMRLMLP